MADKPSNITTTLKSLAAEAKDPDPYSIALSDSKVITFPDPLALEGDEGEQFLSDFERMTPGDALKKWLPEKDNAALREEKLTLRQRRHLVQSVLRYYQGGLGDAGEGPGSER